MKIIVRGNPIAKKRPRFFRRGNHVGTYNDQQTEEGRWLWEVIPQITERFTGPVKLTAKFFFSRPNSHFGTGRNSLIRKKSAPEHHVKKPDLDNLVKYVKDCLNGHAWNDDCQVVELVAEKGYSLNPRTELIIEEL